MNKLNLHTANKADDNFIKLAELFPNAVTETMVDGVLTRAIDKDVLMQEISAQVVEGDEERYQFNWPDKKKSVLLANAPNYNTLRPCVEESVNFDTTENLYIEGDNLDVLKLLQETYLGKVKMIYIDPPYNTGKDFVYADDFKQSVYEYMELTEQYDEDGNRMFENKDTNGRFHTDWLNMIYPRLRLARDLLRDDGVIFISISDKEVANLRKICDEIFGEWNFVGDIIWESKTKSQNTKSAFNKLQPKTEHILLYTKLDGRRFNLIQKSDKKYPLEDDKGVYREHILEVMNAEGIRGRETMIFEIDGVNPPPGKQWKLGYDQVAIHKSSGNLFIRDLKVIIKMRPDNERTEITEPFWAFFSKDIGTAESAKTNLTEILGDNGFQTVKPVELIKRFIYHSINKYNNDIILDFFSGSATTAHAVMQLNAEDGGNRKFIMVQLPELTYKYVEEKYDDENGDKHTRIVIKETEAFKAGYKNICEIGKERIRRAGEKIKTETLEFNKKIKDDTAPRKVPDIGFRVLKCDSTNMKDVYYYPQDVDQNQLDMLTDNIKDDRTPEDLLFQVMLDLGVPLSCKIESELVDARKIFVVYQGDIVYLIACFDEKVSSEVVTAIAKQKPYYAVFRDSSMESDSVMTSFEQIFEAYSKDTVRKVL